jgi:hypothetical protein
MAIARALVHPPGRDREAIARDAAAAGLRVEFGEVDDAVEVYPEHWEAMQVADAMMTQLNVGMGGVVGWRFEALPTVCRLLSIPLVTQRSIFSDLRSLEQMVVGLIRERNK